MPGGGTATDGGPLPIGGPTSSAWREELLTRAEELWSIESWILDHRDHSQPVGNIPAAIDRHIGAAQRTAAGHDKPHTTRRALLRHRFLSSWRVFTGSSFERTLGNLDAAEVDLLRLAPPDVLKGTLPSIVAHVNRFLPPEDPRRVAIDRIARDPTYLRQEQRDALITAQHAANTQRRRNLIRLRGFRNLLLGGILVFVGIAVALGLIGHWSPTSLPLCFTPQANDRTTVVCPRAETPVGSVSPDRDLDPVVAATVTGGDVWLVELLGLLGAALVGAATLRKIRSSSTPYGVHVALAVFKLPTGAVTAVVGLLLMRADFVPGLSALDSSAQILGWAVVFGIAQQLVTRFADSQAAGLLENVGGRGAAGDRPLQEEHAH